MKNKLVKFKLRFPIIGKYVVLFVTATPIFILFLFIFFIKYAGITYGYRCSSDFVCLMCQSLFNRFLIVPAIILFVTFVTKDYVNINEVIHYKNRKELAINHIVHSVIWLFVCVVYIIICGALIGVLITSSSINWNNYNSEFYFSRGYITDISFIESLLILGSKLFVTSLFFMLIMMCINVFLKKQWGLIFAFILSAFNIIRYINYYIVMLFGFNYHEDVFWNYSEQLLYCVFLPIFIVAMCVIYIIFMKRKDYLSIN